MYLCQIDAPDSEDSAGPAVEHYGRSDAGGGAWAWPEHADTEPERGHARLDWHRRLAADALAGSSEARRTLVERLQCVPRFLAVKNARLGRPLADEELDELVQEIQVTIWRRLGHFDGRSTIETWAYGCVRHLLWRCLRRKARRAMSLEGIDLVSRQVVNAQLDHDDIYRALDLIARPEALIVRYRHLEFLGFAEIGERLGVSVGCVKARYYRGLKRLREILEPDYRRDGW